MGRAPQPPSPALVEDDFRRVVVVGTSSTGKSTLASTLARRLDVSFIELDALHWEPGWQPADREVFRARVQDATVGDRWVVAGNYSAVRDLVWPRATLMIWLDYSLPRILWQLTRRTFARWWNQELLWGTNRERLWDHFLTRESLYWWVLSSYHRRKREYSSLLMADSRGSFKMIRFGSPRETADWLSTASQIASRSSTE
ncbi:MAG: adenylate kinase [Chloroflexota bacterium]